MLHNYFPVRNTWTFYKLNYNIKICVSDFLKFLFLFFRSLCEDSSDAEWQEAEEEKDND